MKLSEFLAIKHSWTNAGVLAHIAGGCGIGSMVCASFPSESIKYAALAFFYMVLFYFLNRFDRRQYGKELLAEIKEVQA